MIWVSIADAVQGPCRSCAGNAGIGTIPMDDLTAPDRGFFSPPKEAERMPECYLCDKFYGASLSKGIILKENIIYPC